MESPMDISLVPARIPAALTQRLITTAGRDGANGSIIPPGVLTAGYGQNGKSGEDATSPDPGSSGNEIEIFLNLDVDNVESIEVTSEEHGEFGLSSQEYLFLDTHGGNGGNGGCGGDGQHGGQGYSGVDATRDSEATNGQRGGAGGDAGRGTNGGNGGNGGNIFTTVHDDELDLLLAVECNVKGGTQGRAGKHGVPGKGGRGGAGGSEIRMTIFIEDTRGPHGYDGRPATTPLRPGHHGEDGCTFINILGDNNTVRSYPSRYHIVVESFDVSDENNDGINEPGEYLFVKNIVVRNEGVMPSPSGQLIKVVIRSSTWLEPDTTTPIILPDSIMPNERAEIRSQLRALIRHEVKHRDSGERLNERDTVSLLAYSERLHRAIPEFSGGVHIIIQYPLQLACKSYVDCMEKGDEMTMSWTVKNVSTANYGNLSSRTMYTRLIDTGQNFVLQNSEEDVNYTHDDIDQIPPGGECDFGESFLVSDETLIFSTGSFSLELHLSDPHSGTMRRIMYHKVDIQISEGYKFKVISRILLIVNASTKNSAITEIQRFIRTELYLEVDILNLSLTGTPPFDEGSKQNSLLRYKGKSVIISGNPFNYFSRAQRYNWELIDPRDARALLASRTCFLFCGVDSRDAQNSLANWIAHLTYPADLRVGGTEGIMEHKDRKALLKSIRTRTFVDGHPPYSKDQYIIPDGNFWGSREKRLQSKGTDLARKLARKIPMRRFLVTTEDPVLGSVSVVEGLSKSSNCTISHLPIVDADDVITFHQVIMMIASIPPDILASMFWNIIRSVSSEGITAEVLYQNTPGYYTHRELNASHGYGEGDYHEKNNSLIDYKICEAFTWAVEHALDSDIQQLCNGIQLFHSITKKNALPSTSRLLAFLDGIPNDTVTVPQQGLDFAVQVLGSLNAGLKGSSIILNVLSKIPGLRTRRMQLRRSVSKYHKEALVFMAPKSLRKEIENQIKQETRNLMKELNTKSGSPNHRQNIIHRKLKALTGESTHGYVDAGSANDGSAYFSPSEFDAHRSAYNELINQQTVDAEHARATRRETINPVSETLDFLPVTSFR